MFKFLQRFKSQPAVEQPAAEAQPTSVEAPVQAEEKPLSVQEQIAEIDGKLAEMQSYTERRAYVTELAESNQTLAYLKLERQGDFHDMRGMYTAADIVDGHDRMDLVNHVHELDRKLHTLEAEKPNKTLAIAIPNQKGNNIYMSCSYNAEKGYMDMNVVKTSEELPEDCIILQDDQDKNLSTAVIEASSHLPSVTTPNRRNGEEFDAAYKTLNGEMTPEQFQEFAQSREQQPLNEAEKDSLRQTYQATRADDAMPTHEPELDMAR